MALLALSSIRDNKFVEQELYLNDIIEIIEYQQKHRNLTKLAYQSVWKFLINRSFSDGNMEEVILKDLHFAKKAAIELNELTRYVDWKRKEEGKEGKETKEERIIESWLKMLGSFIYSCELWNEEFVELFGCIAEMFRAMKDDHRGINYLCLSSFRCSAESKHADVDILLKSGAIDSFFEEMKQSILNGFVTSDCLYFFLCVSRRLKENTDGKMKEAKRMAAKREMIEKMEEEGYEDYIISLHKIFNFLNDEYYNCLSLSISDYFVSV
ncbi:uncharacterized protein MONOS_18327 [Monocercomonoides exilis]|uniref:uncharacterized protein n=1 Tax=Monocercomonoides exilis TaxID=2049356 RepID=UPI003559AE4B|nr:hypothetical protein MONOS_18327 [Monocercomonoides exilis]